MTQSVGSEDRIILTRKRLPVAFRVFLASLAGPFLACAVFVVASPGKDSAWEWVGRLLVSVIPLLSAYLCIQAVMFKGSITWDNASRELSVISHGLIPRHSRERFPTGDVKHVRLRKSRGLSGSHWELWLVPASGKERLLVLLGHHEPGEEIAAVVAETIGATVL